MVIEAEYLRVFKSDILIFFSWNGRAKKKTTKIIYTPEIFDQL